MDSKVETFLSNTGFSSDFEEQQRYMQVGSCPDDTPTASIDSLSLNDVRVMISYSLELFAGASTASFARDTY